MYDIVVVGGGTSGCAAAYTAGKLGLKVLLLEKNIHLGGAITSGLVVPVMLSGENQINTDFYSDLIMELKNIGGQTTYNNNSGWFNPELTKIALDNLLRKASVEVRFCTTTKHITHSINHINAIYVSKDILSEYNYTIDDYKNCNSDNNLLFEPIDTRYVIDATGNCEIGKILNCNFLDDSNEIQPVSLRFIMSGVNNKKFADWICAFDTDRDVTTSCVIDGITHFSTAYTWDTDRTWALGELFDNAVADGTLKDTDRNYFQIFSVAGTHDSVAFNCPRLLENICPTSVKDISFALNEGRQIILRLSNFCKKYLPGFQNAYISNIADALGVRVSNRIKGRYIYKEEDILNGKKFDNPAVISSYPIDVHSAKKDNSTLQSVQEYQLPIESLSSIDFDNLFVVGRCLSAEYKAQGALRVQGSCFSMGEAVAKHIYKLL